MGEEVKTKPEEGEEKKVEEPKAQEEESKKDGEDKTSGDAPAEEAAATAAAPPPPPPEEIEMRVFMHCEGCARKVRRCLKDFPGVEEVKTDCRTHKVVVKGKKAAEDPLKVVERVEKKTGRKVELLTPLPPPKVEEEKKEEEKKKEEEENPKVEEEKKEEPVVIAVVLKVHMHCEACAQQIKKRILKMKGVQAVDTEIKASQVIVKGVFEPPQLVEYVYKRTGKHAIIVKTEPEKKPDEEKAVNNDEKKPNDESEKPKDEKKTDEKADEKEKKEGEADESTAMAAALATGALKVEQKRNEFYYYYPRYPVEYAYPPQMFSDENPNACSVM